MKEFVSYKLGTIKDFKGRQHLLTACLISEPVEEGLTASWDGLGAIPIVRALKYGIVVYNNMDKFDISFGKFLAHNMAQDAKPFMFITKGSIINEAITQSILDKIIENANKEPATVFPNYAENAKKYKEIQESREYVDNGDESVETVVQLLEDGIDVQKILDKASPYLKALDNGSSLVD